MMLPSIAFNSDGSLKYPQTFIPFTGFSSSDLLRHWKASFCSFWPHLAGPCTQLVLFVVIVQQVEIFS
jgi:hypothetical protein